MTIEQFKNGLGVLYEPVPFSGCWLWLGSDSGGNGYGRPRFGGRLGAAHREMWVIENGAIPDGMQVLHKCDTPPCVNPAHLFLGTHADNMRDRFEKGHYPCGISANRGEANGMSKLTIAEVKEIKALLAEGVRGCDVAEYFGLSPQTICNIKHERIWAHVATD